PPHIGQGPCLLRSALCETPNAERIPGQRPTARSFNGSRCIASLRLCTALREANVLRTDPVVESSVWSRRLMVQPNRPMTIASHELSLGIVLAVVLLLLEPQKHRIDFLRRMRGRLPFRLAFALQCDQLA